MKGKIFILATIVMLLSLNAHSDGKQKLPDEVSMLLNNDSRILFSAIVDLNGDKNDEYLIAIQLNEDDKEYEQDNDRILFIITRDKNHFKIHSFNKKILLCSACGGQMGDPFNGITTGKKWFAVNHFGGSREKWSQKYKFGYSRKYDKWQLIEANEELIDSLNPESSDNVSKKYFPPKDYGLINFEDFDPNTYLGQGLKLTDGIDFISIIVHISGQITTSSATLR
jgi:hypothetical protein